MAAAGPRLLGVPSSVVFGTGQPGLVGDQVEFYSVDLADLALLDQPVGLADFRIEPVRQRQHQVSPGPVRLLDKFLEIFCADARRLFGHDMATGLQRGLDGRRRK